jgi:plastocyanin
MERLQANHAGGISLIAFVLAVAISVGYYQFVYVPEASRKPIVPEEVLNPIETTQVMIAPGASLQTNEEFFVPDEARTTIGISNRVMWTNEDNVAHTVTSEYVDQINGPFNSLEQQERIPGGYLLEGKSFEFTFTKVGEYSYFCVPHPHMKGIVKVIENFA